MLHSPQTEHRLPVTRTGGQLIVDCLVAHGVDTVFCVPGESYLTVLDALRDAPAIRVIVGRHEASVANMAEAYGKVTGRPGVCFVTRGPGAAQGAIGLHTATQDCTPLIMFVGQVPRDKLGREASQEMDFRAFFGSTSKWVTEIVDPARAPEQISRAFHMAVNGRPGPVVISIPEDMQDEVCTALKPAPYKLASAAPSADALAELEAMVEGAERPLVILGGGGWSAQAVDEIRGFAETFNLPVVTGFRRQDLFDNTHPNYVGNIGLGTSPAVIDLVKRADLLLVVGERLGDMTTQGYTLIDFPRPRQKLIHIHPGPEELGVLYETDLPITATVRDFAKAAAALTPKSKVDRAEWIEGGHRAYLAFSTAPATDDGKLNAGRIIAELSDRLPADAVITNGAGLYTANVHRYHRYRTYGGQLAPLSGAMGYGFPAALTAKLMHPERTVVCYAGDGCFMMAAQELATAAMYGIAVIVVVIDNASYGSIRFHQEKYFPDRVIATDLVNPDFVALAKAYGAYAERVEDGEDFHAAFARAQASGLPALLTFRQDVVRDVNAALGKTANQAEPAKADAI
ncbi:MAG TPA: thiamine pyrophosphate-binding protein [Caulobacteraceae bacterium]|jgi:acetolactate synthase-1/2/3 large subunit|nr:thiamine pyrophosphate-binding protein [Caulobacteraceae bacterium]